MYQKLGAHPVLKIEIIYRSPYFSELFIYNNQQSKWYYMRMNLSDPKREVLEVLKKFRIVDAR